MLTFLIVLIGLSILILGHEAGHFFVAKAFRLKIDEFGIGFPPRAFAKKKKETMYSVNWLPFGGFVKIAGEDPSAAETVPAAERHRYFFAQPAWKRALVILAGVFVNFLIGWILVSAVFMSGTKSILLVADVLPGSPAAAAGLVKGDVINGFGSADDFISFVGASPNGPVDFSVFRNGREIHFKVTPKDADGRPKIGVALEEAGTARAPVGTALKEGFLASLQIMKFTVLAFYNLVRNLFLHGSLLEGVVGPVGIFAVANETSHLGFAYLIQLLGLISLNLAVANLIPFPALDGGRLFLILIEKIKGSPVPKRVETAINGIGFVFLIILMVLVTVRDVAHWF